MAVRLRLSRIGKKHAPVYRIIAIDSRKMRDGAHLDNLGTYNPSTDEYIQFHIERFEDWMKKGALPTDSVQKLYKRFKLRAKNAPVETSAAVVEVVEAPVVAVEDSVAE